MSTDPLESSRPLPPARYGRGAMAFHWTMFTLVVIVGVLGLLHDTWPKQTQAFWIGVHALIGLLLWVVLIARLGWRLRHAPRYCRTASDGLRAGCPVPSIGCCTRCCSSLLSWASSPSFITAVFSIRIVPGKPGIAKNRAIFEPTEDIHGYLAYALFGLAGLHALAALWHQFYLHDGVLLRMWPRAPK